MNSRLAFNPSQLDQIRRTSLARIICDNTDTVNSIQPLAFKLPTAGKANQLRPCSDPSIPSLDLTVFREQLVF